MNELTPSQQIAALQKRHIDIGVWREAQQQTLPGLTCQRLASEHRRGAAARSSAGAAGKHPAGGAAERQFHRAAAARGQPGLYLHNLCLQQGFCRTSLIRSTNRKPCWRWWRRAAALRCCRTATAASRGPASAFARCSRRRRRICTRFTAPTASRRS
ncbi:hypothetical protein M5585_06765 [Serratia ureilytica]